MGAGAAYGARPPRQELHRVSRRLDSQVSGRDMERSSAADKRAERLFRRPQGPEIDAGFSVPNGESSL